MRATRIQFDPFEDHYAEVCRTYVTHEFTRLGAVIGADVDQEQNVREVLGDSSKNIVMVQLTCSNR